MTPSHSPFVRKLPCGTVPHGIAHIRSSLGHLTPHQHSAWAVAAEVSTENATSRPADRIALTLRADDLRHAAPSRSSPYRRPASESGTRGDGGTMKR